MDFMDKNVNVISGNIVDPINHEIYPGKITISNDKISEIQRDDNIYSNFIIPGFVDSHIHIESSMLIPYEFSRIAVIHGTVATVSDPHEIANVLGIKGIQYMIENSKLSPLKFYFGASSCVPATSFETSGACLRAREIEEIFSNDNVKFLGEVMNTFGVINNDKDLIEKINVAKKYSKKIDGHAPGLSGEVLEKYISKGITTDHECVRRAEGLEKIEKGMKIQIREGSAAENFEALIPLVDTHYDSCMFCSDDKHPDDLVKGHIDQMVRRSINYGIDIFKILKVSSVNPVKHYGLDVGLLQEGDPADFLVADNLKELNILATYINGNVVSHKGKTNIEHRSFETINNFKVEKKKISDFCLSYKSGNINVIEAIDGQLITNDISIEPKIVNENLVSDIERDILKIAVVNRYKDSEVPIGFIRNFGLKKGAIASSIAHDSHNIVVVGVSDEDICNAVNMIIENRGGIGCVCGENKIFLELPVAGIMTFEEYSKVADSYRHVTNFAKSLGCTLNAPFMTLSFMALLVIPKIKIGDKGLFDSEKFRFIDLCVS
ncbi:MAG TPA: adenine deaminase [Methanofastidiosum sp.]|nr:adenine deaminase [Methanofastidiosum sp.]